MRKTRQEKGITLVALIITIIILLIIAAVTIGSIQNGGIINHAKNARDDYQTKADAENTTLDSYLELIKNNVPEKAEKNGPSIVDEEGNYARGKILSNTTHTNVYDKNGKKIVVPAGFMIPEDPGYDYVEDGIVIQDGAGNEFVWIPVNNLNAFARPVEEGSADYRGVLYNWTTSGYPEYSISSYREPDVARYPDGSYLSEMGITTDLNGDAKTDISDAKYQLQNEFNNMVKSVDLYDGFYVGRYEMSYNGSSAQSKKSTDSIPINSSCVYDSATKRWYGLYSKAQTYENANNSVQSSMIWGCQYDAMISFMGSGAHIDIGDKRNETDLTGSVETDKLKNVYDLYGGRTEFTLETDGSHSRTVRGQKNDGGLIPRNRYGAGDPTFDYFMGGQSYGTRLSLYIKVQD